jgi:hypothetical protein
VPKNHDWSMNDSFATNTADVYPYLRSTLRHDLDVNRVVG